MELTFGGSDAGGAWDWKIAYDACEVATVPFLRRFGPAMRAMTASRAAMLPMLTKIATAPDTDTPTLSADHAFAALIDGGSPSETWPAMIAYVTDFIGTIAGSHRTWLNPSGLDKASIDTPRRAMGHLLGNAVRFGVAHDVMAAGEGIETMLLLRCVMPISRWSACSRPRI